MSDKQTWIDTEFTPFDQGCRERFFLAAASFLYTNREPPLTAGYYFEFGCHKARTMRYCWAHTRHNFDLEYVAFDSFEGLPELGDADSHVGWEQGAFSMSEADFTQTVVAAGMPRERLMTIRGFYSDSLTPDLAQSLLPRRPTIVYVDCDLYSSTTEVLRFVAPLLQPGCLIAFDDWNCYLGNPDRGQKRAWSEFRGANPSVRFEPFYQTHMLASFITV